MGVRYQSPEFKHVLEEVKQEMIDEGLRYEKTGRRGYSQGKKIVPEFGMLLTRLEGKREFHKQTLKEET